jgi:hypothetical protein
LLLLTGVCAGLLLLVLTGAGLVAYCLWMRAETPENAEEQATPSRLQKQRVSVPLTPVAFVKQAPKGSPAVGSVVEGHPSAAAPAGVVKGLSSKAPPPANQPEIDAAIARGVAHLKMIVAGRGQALNSQDPGALALAGWTLLSCGLPSDDPTVAGIIQQVRAAAPEEFRTYHLACYIWCLDKLNHAEDTALIKKMAERLVAGQKASGAWSYECIAGGRQPAEVQGGRGWAGDHSNTQFAVLGLWVAQKHGAVVNKALALAEAHFRKVQADDGSWSYIRTEYRDSMTCAGLLALAAGQGTAKDQAHGSLGKDAQIERALAFLGKRLQMLDNKVAPLDKTVYIGADAFGDLYFLWSLERVAVLFNLETIGGQNWHAWGTGILLRAQRDDGAWEAGHGPFVDTCFALLFLKRVNVASDLTDVLEGLGGVRDPGGKPSQKRLAQFTAEIKFMPTMQPGMVKSRAG